jgi:hypothetical protein
VRISFQNHLFKADKIISHIHNLSREYYINLNNISTLLSSEFDCTKFLFGHTDSVIKK